MSKNLFVSLISFAAFLFLGFISLDSLFAGNYAFIATVPFALASVFMFIKNIAELDKYDFASVDKLLLVIIIITFVFGLIFFVVGLSTIIYAITFTSVIYIIVGVALLTVMFLSMEHLSK